MTKWDYKLVYVHRKSPNEIEALLRQLGQQGWELVSAPHNLGSIQNLVLKRPVHPLGT